MEEEIPLPWQMSIGVKGSRAALLVTKGFPRSSNTMSDALIRLPEIAKFSEALQVSLSVVPVASVPQNRTVYLLQPRVLFRRCLSRPCRFSLSVPPSRVRGKELSSLATPQFSSPSIVAIVLLSAMVPLGWKALLAQLST